MAFDPDKAQRIVDGIAQGEFVADLCREVGISRMTMWRWRQDHADFDTQCAHARERSAAVNEEDIQRLMLEVKTGEVAPDAARVILNGYTWLAKVRAPKVYGDKMDVEMGGSVNVTVNKADYG